MPTGKKRGRGATANPEGRFESLTFSQEEEVEESEAVATRYYKDATRTVIATNDSPDVGFEVSLNPYRGCEHGCIYCYARPTHEYFGLSAGLDFETKIFVKEEAPELLRKELSQKNWQPRAIGLAGVTDPYQPVERRLGLTRRCLEVLRDFRNPVVVISKNQLVLRDIDLLQELAQDRAAAVFLSITTLDPQLARVMEPRTSQPSERLQAVEKLAQAGIPVGVLAAPMIPGLTDSEMPKILKEASSRGARFAGYTVVRLPFGLKTLFEDWLTEHYPLKKEKILSHIRAFRGGKLYRAEFGTRMEGTGVLAEQLKAVFNVYCRKYGLNEEKFILSSDSFRRPAEAQLKFW